MESEDEGEDLALGDLPPFDDLSDEKFEVFKNTINESESESESENRFKALKILVHMYNDTTRKCCQYLAVVHDLVQNGCLIEKIKHSDIGKNLSQYKQFHQKLEKFLTPRVPELDHSLSLSDGKKASPIVITGWILDIRRRITNLKDFADQLPAETATELEKELNQAWQEIQQFKTQYETDEITLDCYRAKILKQWNSIRTLGVGVLELFSTPEDTDPAPGKEETKSLESPSPSLLDKKVFFLNQAFTPFKISLGHRDDSAPIRKPAVSISPISSSRLPQETASRHLAREARAPENKMLIKQSPNDEIECFLSSEIDAKAKQQAAMQTARMFLETDDGGGRKYAFDGEPEQLKLVVAAILWLNPEFDRERMVFSSAKEEMETIDNFGNLLNALDLENKEYTDFRDQFPAPSSSISPIF